MTTALKYTSRWTIVASLGMALFLSGHVSADISDDGFYTKPGTTIRIKITDPLGYFPANKLHRLNQTLDNLPDSHLKTIREFSFTRWVVSDDPNLFDPYEPEPGHIVLQIPTDPSEGQPIGDVLTGIGAHIYRSLPEDEAKNWDTENNRIVHGYCGGKACAFGSFYKTWVYDTDYAITTPETIDNIVSYGSKTYTRYRGLHGMLFMAELFSNETGPVFYKQDAQGNITRKANPVVWHNRDSQYGSFFTIGEYHFSVDRNGKIYYATPSQLMDWFKPPKAIPARFLARYPQYPPEVPVTSEVPSMELKQFPVVPKPSGSNTAGKYVVGDMRYAPLQSPEGQAKLDAMKRQLQGAFNGKPFNPADPALSPHAVEAR